MVFRKIKERKESELREKCLRYAVESAGSGCNILYLARDYERYIKDGVLPK